MPPALAFLVTVAEPDEDHAAALLYELGTTGLQMDPAGPGRTAIRAYFADEPNLQESLGAAFARLPQARIEAMPVPEVDWVARFREGFRAFEAAGFRIRPEWDERPDPRDRDVIVVDPGQAFGTGTHETTRLCLGALRVLAGKRPLGRVLDVGTGSGILAVAAHHLGASLVVGIENDPDALPAAAAHGRLNGVPLNLLQADGARAVRAESFDLVVANITAPLLCSRKEEIAAACRPGGALVLSGLLRDELPQVTSAYGEVGPAATLTDGDWAALVLEPVR